MTTRAVLAVSGGADSMVMASLCHERAPSLMAGIASFDHGTGPAATAAAALVQQWAEARGIPVHIGRSAGLQPSEAAWRKARWEFLRGVSRIAGAPIATAHTEDDQVETVFIRLLRGSGVRGLAGLLAPGPILRPMLAVTREAVRATADDRGIPFLEDPSNADRRYLRNRVRLELLPSIERACPGFRGWLLDLGRAAALWRSDLATAVDRHWAPIVQDEWTVAVPRTAGSCPDEAEAALFWPEVAGRVGVALDRRGTARIASFTTKRASGLRMPLSGGAELSNSRAFWTLRRGPDRIPPERLAPRDP